MTLEHETNHNNDIKTYIESELKLHEHNNQIEVDRLRYAIFKRSAGIFLWVSLVVRQLNDVFDNDGRMDAVWGRLEEIPKVAKETPVSHGDLPLYGLFQDVIMRDTRNIPDLVRLTQLIFCARRPFRPQEIFVALHRSYHKPFDAEKIDAAIMSKQILAISKGLAEVTQAKEPTVQFIHETVQEFLRDCGLHFMPGQSMLGEGNEALKISCLDQIMALDSVVEHFEVVADYEGISTSQHQESQEEVRRSFPFLKYATRHILFHANAAAAQEVPQGPFLDSFPLRCWVPLHNFFDTEISDLPNIKPLYGPNPPILYILVDYQLNNLIRISTDRRAYSAMHENEECPTALHNAIYREHLDSAWTLVGLDPKVRRPRHDEPLLNPANCRRTLLSAILDADDIEILHKVIRDLGVPHLLPQGENDGNSILDYCRSVAAIDCLAEHSMLRNMSPAEKDARHDANTEKCLSHASDVFFIRRAINAHPKLLTGTVWAGRSMLDYADRKRFFSLVALYFELIHLRGLVTLNCWLERAAMMGCLVAVKEAHRRGADLDYQDESGRTILHKMFARNCFRDASPRNRRYMCSVSEYLLLKSPQLGASVDRDGHTALDIIRNHLWACKYLKPGPREPGYKTALEAFVKGGALTKTGFVCKDHQHPWVVVPWISVEFSIRLSGETQFNNIDARDSLGRTALSWCFWSRTGTMPDEIHLYESASNKGRNLLLFPQVDVNSRDNSGRTILEHLIRHPNPHEVFVEELTRAFFKCDALDVNMETSNQHSPLALIVSLYGTWPLELGNIDAEWKVHSEKIIKGMEKQEWLSENLLKTARLLLATRKVNVSEQKRCLAKAPHALQDLILESVQEFESQFHFQDSNYANQQGIFTDERLETQQPFRG